MGFFCRLYFCGWFGYIYDLDSGEDGIGGGGREGGRLGVG